MSRGSGTERGSTAVALILVVIVRLLGRTWRIRLRDESGLSLRDATAARPHIWVVWHNRLLVIPILWVRHFRYRRSAALVSRSKDGAILSRCFELFGAEAIRGSSSRGGASALTEMARRMADGLDIYITPDGPRGPRYSMSPGVVWLAQTTSAPIIPVSIEISSCWRFGRWDGFMVPKPFAKIEVTLHPRWIVPENSETERERLREYLMAHTVVK